jgi:multidrug efflux pump subunit AcrA (membrane-fusion protein)
LNFVTPHSLAVGTPVEVEIDAEEHKNVVLVPREAITREGDETAVFVVDGDKAQRRVVVLGITDGMHAEVQQGVKAGEQVIVHGQAGLPDGTKITIEKADAEDEKPAAEKPQGGTTESGKSEPEKSDTPKPAPDAQKPAPKK